MNSPSIWQDEQEPQAPPTEAEARQSEVDALVNEALAALDFAGRSGGS